MMIGTAGAPLVKRRLDLLSGGPIGLEGMRTFKMTGGGLSTAAGGHHLDRETKSPPVELTKVISKALSMLHSKNLTTSASLSRK